MFVEGIYCLESAFNCIELFKKRFFYVKWCGGLSLFKVFISHSTEDLDIVSTIANRLRTDDFDVYVAEFRPEPGRRLPEKIQENIESSDCVVVLLTSSAIKSVWVQQEIGIAKSSNKVIIPIVEKGVTVKGVLEGVEYIPLDREKLNATTDVLAKSIDRLRRKQITYTTGQAAKLLGISFITVKRWIYSGKMKATKTPSGRYQISKDEIERLKATLKGERWPDPFSKDILDLINSKKIAYLREVQVCLEDKYTHRDIYNKLNQLTPSRLQTNFYEGNRWYFPLGLSWGDVEDGAKVKANLIDVYTKHPRRFKRDGVVYMDYSEFLVEGAMIQAGYTVVAKDTYYFNGIVYRLSETAGRPKDLDFISYIPKRGIYVGVQIKNRMEYPKHDDISELLDICNVLHLKPILVARRVHPMSYGPIRNMGGEVIECKRYFLQPPFPRKKFREIIDVGIPLGVYKWPPEFLVRRFVSLIDKLN